MKCQNLFSGKNKKNNSVCRLLKILPRVLSLKLGNIGRLIISPTVINITFDINSYRAG